MNTAEKLSFGVTGFIEIESGTVIDANDVFGVIEAEGTTVFDFENDVIKGLKNETGYTLLDGKVRYGRFKNINVTSGKLIGYYIG